MAETLNYKNTYIFPPMARYLGYLIAAIGLFGVFSIGFKSLFILVVGLGISFTRQGVLIDLDQRKLKEYTSVYWWKFGKWEFLDNYPYLTVLEIRETQIMYSNANVKHADKNLVFKINLLSDNHYIKLLIKTFRDREKAHIEAQKIADKIGVEKVIYSPG